MQTQQYSKLNSSILQSIYACMKWCYVNVEYNPVYIHCIINLYTHNMWIWLYLSYTKNTLYFCLKLSFCVFIYDKINLS